MEQAWQTVQTERSVGSGTLRQPHPHSSSAFRFFKLWLFLAYYVRITQPCQTREGPATPLHK